MPSTAPQRAELEGKATEWECHSCSCARRKALRLVLVALSREREAVNPLSAQRQLRAGLRAQIRL